MAAAFIIGIGSLILYLAWGGDYIATQAKPWLYNRVAAAV